MPNGYWNRILRVDLTKGTLEVEQPGEAFYRKYMGGSAMAMHYILKEMPADADPLGPDNVLVLSVGPLTGAPISGNSRVMANAKSPLTGAIGDAQAGGFWPAELKSPGSTPSSSRASRPSRSTCGFTTARPSCATPRTCGARTPATRRT